MSTGNGRIASSRQLAANRQNARKSTGPRTPAGRAVSKMNALKHGILSREVLVRGNNRKESERELTALHERFWADLEPVGPVEEMLVDQIVTTHWRLRRALTAESGEIALNVDEAQWKRSFEVPSLPWAGPYASAGLIFRMGESALGNRQIELWLQEVRQAVEQDGELTEAAIQKLLQDCGGQPNSLTRELERFRLKMQQNPEGLDEASLKTQTLTYLERKLESLAWRIEKCKKRERKVEAARQAADLLPSVEVLDKTMRYETKLERQMYRAMNQLERLQRMRKGEAVPAPLAMVV